MSMCTTTALCTTVHEDRRLHAAIGDGHLEDVITLLEGGASVNCYVDGMTPAARAISSQQPTIALAVLRYHPDVHQGWRVFLRRSATPASEVVSSFIQTAGRRRIPGDVRRQPPVVRVGADRHTPLLLLAVQQGYVDIATALLAMGADVNATDDVSNECALHLAVKNGHTDIVRSLLDYEPNVNRIDVNSNAPLHLAVATDNHEVTRLLLDADATVNIPGHGDRLPLHIACHRDSPRIVEQLLNAGAMVNIGDAENATPLHYSAIQGNQEITRLLLATHICCKETDDTGATPLILACQCGHDLVVEALLQSKKVSANEEVGHGTGRRLAIQVAAAAGHVNVLHTLVNNGSLVNQQDSGRYQTALHAAAERQQDAAVCFLIGAGSDPTIADSQGRTALHIACSQGDSCAEVVKMLLQNGSDPNQQDRESMECSLHIAARTGGEELVDMLLQQDSIEVDVVDARGHTPLVVAVQHSRCNIARTLISRGSSLTSEHPSISSGLHTAIRNGQLKLATDLTRHGSNVNHEDESGLTPITLLMQQVDDESSLFRNEDHLRLYISLLFAGSKVGRSDDVVTPNRLSSQETTGRLMQSFAASTAPVTLKWACVHQLRAHLSSLTSGASILTLTSRLPLPVLLQKQVALEYNCLF